VNSLLSKASLTELINVVIPCELTEFLMETPVYFLCLSGNVTF